MKNYPPKEKKGTEFGGSEKYEGLANENCVSRLELL